MPRGVYVRKSTPVAVRFWAKVRKDGPVPRHRPELGPCWTWTGWRQPFGYGTLSVGGRKGRPQLAHRVSWFLHHGEWPELLVLHACDGGTIGCVNPGHLFLGTTADNIHDKLAKGRGRNGITRGEAQHASVLTEALVREIRGRHANGETYDAIATSLGLKRGTVKAAGRGQNWSWL